MKWVDLVEFDAVSRQGNVLARAVLENGHVRLEGDATLAERIRKDGVFSAEAGKLLRPEDGEAFLRALKGEFRNPQLFATDLRQGEKIEPFETPPMRDVPDGSAEHAT